MNYFVFQNKKTQRGDSSHFTNLNQFYNDNFDYVTYEIMLSQNEYDGYLEDSEEEMED